MHWITLESRAGEAVQAGARRLTPLSSVVRLQIPGWHGGLVWNRPAAVLVREPDGQETLLPVRDTTRLAQLLILGAGLLGGWLIWLAFRSRKTK
jgi:hypothetical protein